jgi:hypothetical protein
MSQNKDTQVTIYNDTTEEQGIKNKLSANATIFSHEAELDSDSDSDHQETLQQENQENVELGQEFLADKWKEEDWKNFTSATSGRTATKKILVEERFRLIFHIYNLDSLEWSCLLLAGDRRPSSLDRMAKHLERYLYSANRNIMRIRNYFANIAASLDLFTDVDSRMVRKLAELIGEFQSPGQKAP